MRIAIITGSVCAFLCIVLGAFKFSQDNDPALFTLGCVLSVFWIIMIPGGRHSGRTPRRRSAKR